MPLGNPTTFQAEKGTDPEAGQPQCLPVTLALRAPRPWCLPTLSMNNRSFLVYTVFSEEKDTAEQTYLYFVPLAQQQSTEIYKAIGSSEIKVTCLT